VTATEIAAGPQRILDAARDVFAESGYRGGSLNEVAKRSGYTRAGLLHHFPSKEAMLLALLDLRDEQLEASGIFDPQEGLPALFARLPEVMTAVLGDRTLVQLAHILTAEAADGRHPARSWAFRRHGVLRRRIAEATARSVSSGELPADVDADALATVILGAVEGIEAQWLIDPELPVGRSAETLLRLIGALVESTRPESGASVRLP